MVFNRNNKNAFTLIELLVVLGILVVLLTLVLIAVNPAQHFKDANNIKRRRDAVTLVDAIQQYSIDNDGGLPSGITTAYQNIASDDLDLCDKLVTRYIAEMPYDPETGYWEDCDDYDTGYETKDLGSDNRISVTAPDAQDDENIVVTR